MKVKIIAEAGVNHNGDLGLAKELIAAGAKSGVDVVKFQTFKAENIVTKTAEKAQYQKNNCGADESQYDMLKKLELDEAMHIELMECCKKHGVEFLSTAFDEDSLVFLTDTLGLKTLKIPSGEITNGPFIHRHALTGADIILSTGMATLGEIETALAVLAHGFCTPDAQVTSLDDCYKILASKNAQEILQKKITLLHCTSSYPAPVKSVNMHAMNTMEKAFGLDVGYSDHTAGLVAPIVAVSLGATLIEKHFTLDRNMKGPDHKASLEPFELKQMVDEIHQASLMLGSGVKMPHPIELDTKDVARKSLVAKFDIEIGDNFSSENITFKRPGNGISPNKYWNIIGKAAHKNYGAGDLIDE
ncbi:N-acetylneuraminate synthase [Paremcibacter congregatus]|uniref:N-acetylneuraminate synthase n=1 Tax=Paremcibacter congregatus TaxID=2043170 RepID=UPI0030EE47B3|tara:strand:+ start:5695 stop:6771 length:1077 start_codon:yes stop_codon:yes gene_type:complete